MSGNVIAFPPRAHRPAPAPSTGPLEAAVLRVDPRIGVIRLLRGLELVGLTLTSVGGELVIRESPEFGKAP